MVSSGVSESASASKEITQTIANVDQEAKNTRLGEQRIHRPRGQELSRLSEELQTLVNQFKT